MKGSYQLILARGAGRKAVAQLAQLLIFGDIGDLGSESSVTAKSIVEQLNALNVPELLVRLNTYGGRVDEGLAIYNALRAYKGKVTVRVEGIAASIGSVIAMAGVRTEMAKGSMMMIHPASSGAYGNSNDLASAAESLDKADRTLAEIYSGKSGRSLDEELARLKAGGDRWFTAEEAVAEGYADAIYEPDAETATAAAPNFTDALLHHLPAAGAYASALRTRLTASANGNHNPTAAQPAARAASPRKEKFMNWKLLAQKLGIQHAADATDDVVRAAVLKHLAVADAATDDEVAAALAERAAQAPAAAATQTVVPANPATARAQQIDNLFTIALGTRPSDQRAPLTEMRARALIGTQDVETVRTELLAHLSNPASSIAGASVPGHVSVTTDARDKFRAACVSWLMARAGMVKHGSPEQIALAGNPMRGMSLHDLARECLEASGMRTRGMNRMDVIKAAITHTTSDFPNIFENALNKTLLSGFVLQKPKWDRFSKTSTLTDFRPHIRYRSGSLGDLQVRDESGEYKSLTMSDAERETITALSRGGILNVSREMLVNDDMSVFNSAAMMLGTAAARTLDKAVFALFAMNSGNGPTMGDGKALFHADHHNIAATPGAPTVLSVEAMRVQMASQMDVSGNDFLDLNLDRALSSLSVGGQLRVVNNSTYDPDVAGKLQRDNIVAKLFNDIIDTPRLSGNAWYGLADPNVEPVFEVGFLDGVSTPVLASEEAFNQHGMKWRVVYEFGVAAVGWRGIVKNPGA